MSKDTPAPLSRASRFRNDSERIEDLEVDMRDVKRTINEWVRQEDVRNDTIRTEVNASVMSAVGIFQKLRDDILSENKTNTDTLKQILDHSKRAEEERVARKAKEVEEEIAKVSENRKHVRFVLRYFLLPLVVACLGALGTCSALSHGVSLPAPATTK